MRLDPRAGASAATRAAMIAATMSWVALVRHDALPRPQRAAQSTARVQSGAEAPGICCCARMQRAVDHDWLPADVCTDRHGACVAPDRC
jgi:hypothetical protein